MKPSCIFIIVLCVLWPLREVNGIVGGLLTNIGEFTCVCSLRYKGEHRCTGTYLGGTKVLTAAHCVKFAGFDPQFLTVHFGTAYLDQVGTKRFVESVTVAPGFNKETLANDCAVVRVKQPVAGVTPCALSTAQLINGVAVKAVGWGKTKANNAKPSNRLRHVNIDMMSKVKCIAEYKGRYVLSESMICAAEVGMGICLGDDGGPLFLPGTEPLLIHGITSWSDGCAKAGSPSVFTSIRKMTTFINNN